MLQLSCVMFCRQQQIVSLELHMHDWQICNTMLKTRSMTAAAILFNVLQCQMLQPFCLMCCSVLCACRDGPGCEQWACWLASCALQRLVLLKKRSQSSVLLTIAMAPHAAPAALLG